MENEVRPSARLAEKTLPAPLRKAIESIFAQKIEGTALVGGTALSGYYAGHRRSDDIDLFSSNERAFCAAVLATKHLEQIGASFSNSSQSAQYFHTLCAFKKHHFTIDVVWDPRLFVVGQFETAEKNVVIPSLETLLRMKVAALVSRASEKDLFDIHWLLDRFQNPPVTQWIELGQSIDSGVNAQNLLASIAGTQPRKEACDFGLQKSKEEIYKQIDGFRKHLIALLKTHLKSEPTPPLGKLLRKIT